MVIKIKRIQDEKDLLETLIHDIEQTEKQKIALFAGHFPLVYGAKEDYDFEGTLHWGFFSHYTLYLASRLGKRAREIGKKPEFIIFVDDHSYEDWKNYNYTDISGRRRRLYRERSGEKSKLPDDFALIMKTHGFSEKDVKRHDHQKLGRRDCLYFSEKILRASSRQIDNACAREYIEFLEDPRYFDKKTTHLVSFIPRRCQGHICDVALPEIDGISSSHVSMESMLPTVKAEELYALGVYYIKTA